MGGGSYNVDTTRARNAAKAAQGIHTFAHTQATRAKPASQWTANDLLDPKAVAGPQSPFAGKVMRECCVTDEHPDPTPIVVILDVTGSMGRVAHDIHKKLGELSGLLTRKGYCNDPQILFGAAGDANSDRVPIQVGQFESDDRLAQNLEAIFLEGNGGGQSHETYELVAYFLANHTHLESHEKFGKKGYVFFIGDERAYPQVKREHITSHIGDTVEADVPTAEVFDKLKETFNVFFIYPTQASYDSKYVLGENASHATQSVGWRAYLDERALEMDDLDSITELIGATIGVVEGATTLDDSLVDLKDMGTSDAGTKAIGKALAKVGGGTAVAQASGDLPGLE